jgi:hypothetical protein
MFLLGNIIISSTCAYIAHAALSAQVRSRRQHAAVETACLIICNHLIT